MQFIADSYLPFIAKSLWDVDDDQIRLQLKGIMQLPDIEYCSVVEKIPVISSKIAVGDHNGRKDITREFPLIFKGTQLGTLFVHVSLAGIYKRLENQAFIIFSTNAIRVFFLAAIVMMIFHFLVVQHLTAMADYTKALNINKLDDELILKRWNYQDEITRVSNSINDMRQRLRIELENNKKTMDDLKFTNTVLSTQQETSMDGILIVDENGRILSYNRRFREIWNIPEFIMAAGSDDTAIQSVLDKLVDPEKFKRRIDSIYKHPQKNSWDEILLKDGMIIERFSSPMRSQENIYNGRVWYFKDITARRSAEQMLKFTQFTVDQAKIAVFWCHADGNFLYVNEQACEWLQYRREELLKMHMADINPELPNDAWSDHWKEIKTKGLVRMESVHRRKNGDAYPVEIYSNYVEFEDKEYLLEFVLDISARIKTEKQKKRLEEQMRQMQKMEAVGTLAGGVAHDFNNMLSPILGYSELLLRDRLEEKQIERVKQVHRAGLRARDLTRHLLAFGRKQPLRMTHLDVNEVILGFDKMLRRTIREDVNIEKHLAPVLPAIMADEGQIEQVILNLAINAQDAMPGGGTITIETSDMFFDKTYIKKHIETEPGTYAMIAISDTGAGMDKETMDRIFEPFFTTKDKGKGTGLGLSTVYGIVKQHRGFVWVYSELGKGTTLKVYFPQSEQKAVKLTRDVDFNKPVDGDETILVVEDQMEVRELACETLEHFGYHPLAFENGQKALTYANQFEGSIHLLLTDIVMPSINGKELYKKLSDVRKDMKVLYMSGYTDNIIVHHGVMDQGVNFIQKPFSIQGLAAKIREVLDSA